MDWLAQLMQLLSQTRGQGIGMPAMPAMPQMSMPPISPSPWGIPLPPPPLPPAAVRAPRPVPVTPAPAPAPAKKQRVGGLQKEQLGTIMQPRQGR